MKEYSELSGSTTHLSVGDGQWLSRITGRKNETSYEKNLSQFDPHNQLAFETLTITKKLCIVGYVMFKKRAGVFYRFLTR